MLEYDKKRQGAFFTSGDIAHYLTRRVVENENQEILEPSFGDGSFLDAIIDRYCEMGWEKSLKKNIHAVEIREDAIAQYNSNPFIDFENFIPGDFLSVEPFPIDVVIGNPPYVGLNKISALEQNRARRLLSLHNFTMQSSGSLWFPFIMHSCAFLKRDGVIAFVLPFELTYVRYSKQLWKYLGQHFSELTVVRVFEDIFPDVDVETILFIARGFGGSTNFVTYEIYDSKEQLFGGIVFKKAYISIASILSGERPFVSNLLDPDHLRIIQELRSRGLIIPISSFCKFKIGYVSADQTYFHPGALDVNLFQIAEDELIPSIASAKVLKGNIGLEVKSAQIPTKLFYPKASRDNHPYVKYGELQQVHKRFKCRQRSPWYITPGVETPDIILSVFGDKPRMYINSGRYLASNSLLCGFIKPKTLTAQRVAASWYNSLTLLSVELRIHSLGGGVLVFIPGETDSLEVFDPEKLREFDDGFFARIDHLLSEESTEEAYLFGDMYALDDVGLSQHEISLIREAVQTLRRWRNPKLRKNHKDDSETEQLCLLTANN